MNAFLISVGISLVIGVIMGIISVLIIPEIAWWQIVVLIGGTVILTSFGTSIEKKFIEKGKSKDKN